MSESKMRFIYFNHDLKTTKHNGITCVCYYYDLNEKKIIYAITQCSPKDRFSKNLARRILRGRIENKNTSFVIFNIEVTHGDFTEPKYSDCIEFIRDDINTNYDTTLWSNHPAFPSWFKGLV